MGFKDLSILHKPKQRLIHTMPDVFFKEHICFHLLNPPTLNSLFQPHLIKTDKDNRKDLNSSKPLHPHLLGVKLWSIYWRCRIQLYFYVCTVNINAYSSKANVGMTTSADPEVLRVDVCVNIGCFLCTAPSSKHRRYIAEVRGILVASGV